MLSAYTIIIVIIIVGYHPGFDIGACAAICKMKLAPSCLPSMKLAAKSVRLDLIGAPGLLLLILFCPSEKSRDARDEPFHPPTGPALGTIHHPLLTISTHSSTLLLLLYTLLPTTTFCSLCTCQSRETYLLVILARLLLFFVYIHVRHDLIPSIPLIPLIPIYERKTCHFFHFER
jgi:hypothetical protein